MQATSTTYKKGDRAYKVSEIQFLLAIALGLPSRSLIPDSYYGELTEKAIKIFQQRNGLEVTGECDRNTWEMLCNKTGRGNEVTNSR